jgi:hypothetical protein
LYEKKTLAGAWAGGIEYRENFVLCIYGLEEIGEYVFSTTSLVSINIPPNVRTINEGAFIDCSDLTTIDIPPNVRAIEDSFLRCGGNRLHRILERILFEMWRELPPQNFGVVSF